MNTQELKLGSELVYWERWTPGRQKTQNAMLKATVISKGRKLYTVSTPGGKLFKLDPKTLCSTGQHPTQFYVSVEAVMQKQWCEKHGYLIGESVRYQPFDVLQKIADLISYKGDRLTESGI